MKRSSRTALPEWRALEKHAATVKKTHLRDWFALDPERGTRFAVEGEGLYLDYSRQAISSETLRLLLDLAQACDLPAAIAALFSAAPVNGSEKRPALHWALRDFSGRPVMVDGVDVAPGIRRVRERMAVAAEKLRSGRWTGHGGKPLTHVVNLGIGGSDLGPQMACLALRSYAPQGLQVHFVSNLDPGHLAGTLRACSPETTLFIIASKTFTTQETMANAAFARAWLLDHFADPAAVGSHFAAVTANPPAALDWGVAPGNVFEFWEWVGGRYSLASAVGLPLMMAIGPDRFQELLQGCAAMDKHFRSAPAPANLPLLLALIGVWNSNFLDARTSAVLPYAQDLSRFPAFLQQLEMESNGKSTDRAGRPLALRTAPVIWGEPGTNGQHAFYQLLHQGTQAVPCDLIGFCRSRDPFRDHQQQLLANMLAQGQALAFGRSRAELEAENVPAASRPFREFAGNRPSTTILAEELTPGVLGKLIALYEHKVYVQGVIWDINSFDQWGVELGKQLSKRILPKLKGEAAAADEDSSTRALIEYFKKHSSK